MSIHCGDEVFIKYKIEAPLVGERGIILLRRIKKSRYSGTYDKELKKPEEIKIEWPDQWNENDGEYYGGCKVDLVGLNKLSFNDRWDFQEFRLNFFVLDDEKSSDVKKIDKLPEKGLQTITAYVPCILEHRLLGGVLDELGFTKIPKLIRPKPVRINQKMGRFDIEFKEGETIITVAVKLLKATKGLPSEATLFDEFKKKVEGFWNGPAGFRGFSLHRIACARNDECNCKITYNNKGDKLVSGGCCNVPVRLVIEDSIRHGLRFGVYKRRFWNIFAGAHAPFPISSSSLAAELSHLGISEKDLYTKRKYKDYDIRGRINYPEVKSNTWAHEVGHCLGFPDQYLGGHNWDKGTSHFPIKNESIMGGSQNRADKDHLYYAEDFMGSDFKVIST
jgi:hypothetical protein